MKWKLIIAYVFMSMLCKAQKDTDKIEHFRVKATTDKYIISPWDNYLFTGCKNKIKIVATGKNKLADVKITNGKIAKLTDSTFVISWMIPGTALLTIYETSKDGKKLAVALNKKYIVISYPILIYNGTKCDSVITRLMLCGGTFYADYERGIGRIKVEGFKMDILEDGKFVTDSSNNNRVTPKMREYIKNIREGSIVYLKDVKYYLPDKSLKVEPIFRLFIGKDEKRPSKFYLGD